MRALFSKIQSGVESPQAFAAYARSLKIAPEPGVLLNPGRRRPGVRARRAADRQRHAVREQHVRRVGGGAGAQAGAARLLVARYGVRDKLKPFSSLLLFSQPRLR